MGVTECDELRSSYVDASARVEAAQAEYSAANVAYSDFNVYEDGGASHERVGTATQRLDAARLERLRIRNDAESQDWNIVHLNRGHVPCLGATACQVSHLIGLPMPAGWAERNAGVLLDD